MRIGVDIDGVTSDSYTVWLGELNRYYSKNIEVLEDYNLHLVYNVSWDDMNNFFVENVERLFMLPPPMKGAKQGIETLLAKGHEVIYVTARSPEEKDVTVRWMDKYKIPYEHIIFSGMKSKVDLVKEWQLELFIEDYVGNAEAIAKSGIQVLLLNASYNQGELPEGVTRCRDWPEIIKEIDKITKIES